jgi:transmembrane sensor
MSVIPRFGKEIARAQDALLGGRDDVARAREGFLSQALSSAGARARPVRMAGYALAAGLAAAAAIAISIVLPPDEDDALTAFVGESGAPVAAGEWISAPPRDGRRIRFSDGSSVVLGPASAARVIALDAKGARVFLEQGTARATVTRRPGARWTVEVGPYAVEVTGTRFSVTWEPEPQLFSILLEEGHVVVRGPLIAEGRKLVAGESIRAWVAERRLEIGSGGAPAVASAQARASVAPVADVPAPAALATSCVPATVASRGDALPVRPAAPQDQEPQSVPPEGWQELARSGSWAAAIDRADRAGLDAIVSSACAADLLLLGDAARLSRRFELAEHSYLATRERFPGTAESVGAAFALGRMAFDQQHFYAKSAEWLARYLEESGGGTVLAREALGRLVEAHSRAGNLDLSREAARRYLATFPDGPHAGFARRTLEEADPARTP